MSQKHNNGVDFLLAQTFATGVVVSIIQAAFSFRNVTDALGFYGVYHRDPVNQAIHFFGVPALVWSALLFFAHLPLPWFFSSYIRVPGAPSHRLTFATVTSIVYAIFYLKIDRIGGLMFSPVIYWMYVSSVRIFVRDQADAKKRSEHGSVGWKGSGSALKLAAIVQVFGWYVQIHPGHAIFEGAKPALLDGLGQALTSAPLFAFYEGLWFLGINRELQQLTLEVVKQNTLRLCSEGATMRACANL